MKSQIVIYKPIITEKSMLSAQDNYYTFRVDLNATKRDIKKAIEQIFKVNVISVKTVILKGKTRKTGKRRSEITLSSEKKAIVFLKNGQKIDLFDTGGAKT